MSGKASGAKERPANDTHMTNAYLQNGHSKQLDSCIKKCYTSCCITVQFSKSTFYALKTCSRSRLVKTLVNLLPTPQALDL